MTEREKLIELLKAGGKLAVEENHKYIKEFVKNRGRYNSKTDNNVPFDAIVADYLLENGVVVPPVKIGDTVYVVVNPFNTKPYFMPYFITSTVCAVHIADGSRNSRNHKRESYFLAECPNTKYVKKYPLSKIGKTIFTSCEAAEKALKERENNV